MTVPDPHGPDPNGPDPRGERALFERALELPPEERADWVAERCEDDPALLERLLRLLDAHDRADELLGSTGSTATLPSDAPRPAGAQPYSPVASPIASPIAALEASLTMPERIGPYRILERLGSGGMGEVYLAEQEEPVRRQVALKVVKLGMDTREVLERFESERQALALMTHPHIARIFDAGSTAQGRPYFVMEHVPGLPITEFCRRRGLDVDDRLMLLRQVCLAVQHAHQKGIIHRDLKPSNVLVVDGGEVDGVLGTPKIIDFGVAKATGPGLTDRALHTRLGQMVGTPEYMSPEQAEASELGIDTRTDVYSLGVLLYELLTGQRPFDVPGTEGSDPSEVRRRLREEEPQAPSRCVEGAAARRLRGELDWIALRALARDPADRYPTAQILAQEIERHLRDEPVEAGPPTLRYRLGKLARRHRVVLATAAVVVLALAVGVVLAVYGLVEARQERDRAEQETRKAEAVVDFLAGLFVRSDPTRLGAPPAEKSVGAMLDDGVEALETELSGQPLVRAALYYELAEVYRQMADYGQAEELARRSLSLRRDLLDAGHPDVARSLRLLGQTLYSQGRFTEARDLFADAAERLERIVGPDDPELAFFLGRVANADKRLERFDEAVAHFERAVAILERSRPGSEELGRTLNNYALLRVDMIENAAAASLFRRALAIYEELHGPDHLLVAGTLENLASVLRTEKPQEALATARRSTEITRGIYGDDHPQVARQLNTVGLCLLELDRLDEAEAVLEESLAILDRTVGGDHWWAAYTLRNLATVHVRRGAPERAIPLFERELAVRVEAFGPEGAGVAETRQRLAHLRQELGAETTPSS